MEIDEAIQHLRDKGHLRHNLLQHLAESLRNTVDIDLVEYVESDGAAQVFDVLALFDKLAKAGLRVVL